MRIELTRGQAIGLALALTGLAAWGDAVTTADASFTLLYVFPLALAVWFAGTRTGYAIAALASTCGLIIDVFVGPRPRSWEFLAWNTGAEAALYLLFARILGALRARMDSEARERREAVEQLRHAERLTTVGQLASGIAHELGTPLNVISGHGELIASGQLSAEDVTRSAQAIRAQVGRIATIIRQLLDFSRRRGSEPGRTDLDALVQEVLELLRPIASKAHVDIVFMGDQVVASINASEIQQVATNLISNAIQAMPEGGALELETHVTRARRPHERHAAAKPYAQLVVRDHGTGIRPDVLPKIFDPFFTTKDVGRGTGLGLSVSYGIVADHGGWIAVETWLGVGTCFKVYLPT